MKVALYAQHLQLQDSIFVEHLLDELSKVEAEVLVEAHFVTQLRQQIPDFSPPVFTAKEGLDTQVDLFISFGGDGTMLRAVTYVRDLGIPIVGINTGRLGFLSTFAKEDVRKVITEFLAGAYSIEERTLVEVLPSSGLGAFEELNFALNEITVSRKDTTSMITVETYLDDEYLTSYWADGLIVSTPTGSTGYSLSCGGPVIAPSAKSLVLTPIAPHNLNARPLVISDETEIRLKVSGREENHLISLDSRIASIPNEKEIRIRKSPFTLRMIEYKSESFWKTLRNKLLWGEDRRN
ncbi:MAG: NAD kinase [Bacteroidota bacterium]